MKNEQKHQLGWIRFDLFDTMLDNKKEDIRQYGIYVIWHDCNVLKIGHGNMKKELARNQKDKCLLEYEKYGLHIAFAKVNPAFAKRAELYLNKLYDPEFKNEPLPDVIPAQVTLPFSKQELSIQLSEYD